MVLAHGTHQGDYKDKAGLLREDNRLHTAVDSEPPSPSYRQLPPVTAGYSKAPVFKGRLAIAPRVVTACLGGNRSYSLLTS